MMHAFGFLPNACIKKRESVGYFFNVSMIESSSWARVDNRSVRHNCQQPSQVLPRWYTVDIGCSG